MSEIETFPSHTLQVPDEPGVFWCARHKKVKTRLRCGRCEKPICPRCTVIGPTGARCRDCASNRSSHIYQVSLTQYALAFGAILILSTLAAWLLGRIGFFVIFFAPVVGTAFGKIVSRLTRGKRGATLAAVTTTAVVLGALLANISTISLLFSPLGAPSFLLIPLAYLAIYLALVISSLWWWIK